MQRSRGRPTSESNIIVIPRFSLKDAFKGFFSRATAAVFFAIACVAVPAYAEPTIAQVFQAANAGNLDEAQKMINEVLVAHPNSAKAHYVNAELFAKLGKIPEAANELAAAENFSPGLPFASAESVALLKAAINPPVKPAASQNSDPWYVPDFSPLAGTFDVRFQAVPAGDGHDDCSLIYKVVTVNTSDHKSALVMAFGNITWFVNEKLHQGALALQIELRNPLDPLGLFGKVAPPDFAYLQSSTASTASLLFREPPSSKPNMKFFVFQPKEQAMSILDSVAKGDPTLTIRFNRVKDEPDVDIPLDVNVDSSNLDTGKLQTNRSGVARVQFQNCVAQTLQSLK